MTQIGADPDGLDALAGDLLREGAGLRRAWRSIERAVATGRWSGRDAEQFRSRWRHDGASLQAAATVLEELASSVSAQADQQRAAAAGGGPSAVLPLRTERWEVGLGGGAGLAVGLDASVTVDDLPGSRSRVTLRRQVSGGGAVGLGSGVELHGSEAAGSEGRIDGMVAGRVSGESSWLVDDDRAGAFGRARAAEALVDALPGGAGTRNLLEALTGGGAPAPQEEAVLVGVGLDAGGSGVAGPISAGATGTVVAMVGVRRRGADSSLVVHGDGAGAARLPGLLFGSAVPRREAASGSCDIEVLPGGGGSRTVLVRTTSVEGSTAVQEVTTIVLDDRRLGDTFEEAWERLGRGDLEGAARRLAGLGAAVRSADTVAATGTVHASTTGGTATTSGGGRAQGHAHAGHTVIEWRNP